MTRKRNGIKMTRKQAIAILTEVGLDETIGLGCYSESAAYKLANRDIDAKTKGLSAEVVAAIVAVGNLEFEEIGR